MLPDKACPVVLSSVLPYKILLFRHPLAGVQLVKGTIEKGETPSEAVLRELAEESGISDAVIGDDLGLGMPTTWVRSGRFNCATWKERCLSAGLTRHVMTMVICSSFSGHHSSIPLMTIATLCFSARWPFCAKS